MIFRADTKQDVFLAAGIHRLFTEVLEAVEEKLCAADTFSILAQGHYGALTGEHDDPPVLAASRKRG
jgi:hypothetical protein